MKRKRTIIVVGGVAAGASAAAKAARTDGGADVLLFEQGEHVSYGVCELPYLVSGEIEDAGSLVIHTPASLQSEKRVRAFPRHRVDRILPTQRLIEVVDLATGAPGRYAYDALVLATGCRARTLSVFPSAAENVFTLKTLGDGIALRRLCDVDAPRSVCIVGGGFTGIEAAEAFAVRGIETHLVYDQDLPLPTFEREARTLLRDILHRGGIRLHPSTSILEARVEAGRIRSVRTADGDIDADAYIVAVGLLPNVELARAAGIRTGTDGAILTDQRMMTSVDGIYACGDCVEVLNPTLRKPMMMPFADLAARTGRVAGENAAGGSASFRGSVPHAALSAFGHEFARAGTELTLLRKHGFHPMAASIVSTTRVSFMPDSSSLFVQLAADAQTKKLLAGNIVASEHAAQRANVLALAIRREMTVDELLDADFIYTPRLAPVWDPLLVCARKLSTLLRPPAVTF